MPERRRLEAQEVQRECGETFVQCVRVSTTDQSVSERSWIEAGAVEEEGGGRMAEPGLDRRGEDGRRTTGGGGGSDPGQEIS